MRGTEWCRCDLGVTAPETIATAPETPALHLKPCCTSPETLAPDIPFVALQNVLEHVFEVVFVCLEVFGSVSG